MNKMLNEEAENYGGNTTTSRHAPTGGCLIERNLSPANRETYRNLRARIPNALQVPTTQEKN
jgi:hypothetical protein